MEDVDTKDESSDYKWLMYMNSKKSYICCEG